MKERLPRLIILVVVVACTRQDPLNLKARSLWLKHQRVVEAAARGEVTDVAEFKDAAEFFDQVASIDVPGDHSPVIYWYPNRKTPQAVEPLRRWYQTNGERLYWDQETGKVQVRP